MYQHLVGITPNKLIVTRKMRKEEVTDRRKIVLTVMFDCFCGKFNQINVYYKEISNQSCAIRYRHLDSGSKAE